MKKTPPETATTPPAAAPAIAAQPPAPEAAPDWVTETPEQHCYSLEMDGPCCGNQQEVELSRSEYTALKQHLAQMRGYVEQKPAEATAAAPINATAAESSASKSSPEAARGLDLLRIWISSEMPTEKEKALRAQLLEQIMRSLPDMSASRIQAVAQVMDLCNNDRGCPTPVEEFITDLVMHHYHFGGLNPERVMREFEGPEGFKINYEECIEAMERFNAAYPKHAPAA